MNLKMPSGPFAGGQNFQAGGPPASQDRFGKLFWQPFLAHLISQAFIVIPHWKQFTGDLVVYRMRGDKRVPDGGLSIIGRASDYTNVDQTASIGYLTLPLNPRMSAEDD